MAQIEQGVLIELIELGKDSWNQWKLKNKALDLVFDSYNFLEANLSGYDFSSCVFKGCDFSKADLTQTLFVSSTLDHCNFSFANLSKASFIAAQISYTTFTLANVDKANFLTTQINGCDFSYVDFSGHNLQGMNFSKSNLKGANLKGQNLKGVDFSDASLTQAELENANFSESNLSGCDLSHSHLKDCNLAGAYCKAANFSYTDLSHLDLHEINFNAAKFIETDLRYANLANAHLNRTTLNGAKLFEAKINGWQVKNTLCDHAFWDKEGLIKTRYKVNEFERLHGENVDFELRLNKHIAPHELSSLPILMEHLEATHWGVKLRIKTIDSIAGGTRIIINVEDTAGYQEESLERELKDEANKIFNALYVMRENRALLSEFKQAMAQVKNQFWPKLLELAEEHEDGQTRHYTVMLMDLKGFSRWHGDELSEKLDLFRGLIKPLLKRWNANYPNMEGDSLRASFKNASIGVTCACMITKVLSAAGFPCRIGLDFGEVVLQHNEVTEQFDMSGEAVNIAARLEGACETGEVLISQGVWHFVSQQKEYFKLTPKTVRFTKAVASIEAGEDVNCFKVELVKPLV